MNTYPPTRLRFSNTSRYWGVLTHLLLSRHERINTIVVDEQLSLPFPISYNPLRS